MREEQRKLSALRNLSRAKQAAFIHSHKTSRKSLHNAHLRDMNHNTMVNTDPFAPATNREAAAPLFTGPCVLSAQLNGE